jgi:hypothetical protein
LVWIEFHRAGLVREQDGLAGQSAGHGVVVDGGQAGQRPPRTWPMLRGLAVAVTIAPAWLASGAAYPPTAPSAPPG